MKNYLLFLDALRCLREALRVFVLRVFVLRVLRLPPLNTVTGGLTTPVCGSIENWRAISILDTYLLLVALRPLRVALRDLRALRVLRLPPFNGIPTGQPIPPGKLHQT